MSKAGLEAALVIHNGRTSLSKDQQADLFEQAKTLIQAGFFPKKFKTPQQAFIAALYGHEIGLSPQQSWKQLHVIENMPAPEVHLQVAMVRKAIPGLIWKIIAHSQDVCTIEHGRTPDALQTTTFHIDEAKHLVGKDNWRNSRRDMLYCRAAGRAVRWHYPETQGGGMLHNDQELMDGVVPPPPAPAATVSPGAKPVPKKGAPKEEIEEAQVVTETTAAPAATPTPAPAPTPQEDADEKEGKEAILELRAALTVADNPNTADWAYSQWREKNAQRDATIITEGYKIFADHLNLLERRK